jgi:chromate transport protein ChrA
MSKSLEVVRLFLKLGFTAFGGPAAHIAIMHDEVVKRRKWLTDEEFLDLLGATNLIPGPNSTEMAIHIGYLRAGWAGLFLTGICFVLPATLMDHYIVAITILSLTLLLRYKINPTWLIASGAAAGFLISIIR